MILFKILLVVIMYIDTYYTNCSIIVDTIYQYLIWQIKLYLDCQFIRLFEIIFHYIKEFVNISNNKRILFSDKLSLY